MVNVSIFHLIDLPPYSYFNCNLLSSVCRAYISLLKFGHGRGAHRRYPGRNECVCRLCSLVLQSVL